jgi:chitinase
MDGNSGNFYSRFSELKDTNMGLQTCISVGGWSFTDPGPTRSAFSDMSSNFGNCQKFIKGLISFIDNYGFDGMDLRRSELHRWYTELLLQRLQAFDV